MKSFGSAQLQSRVVGQFEMAKLQVAGSYADDVLTLQNDYPAKETPQNPR